MNTETPETPAAAAEPAAATAGRGNKKPRPKPVHSLPWFRRWGVVLVLLAFAVLALEYMRADLWFDELLTLHDYGLRPRLLDVFRQYKVANNHILFSAVLWVWLHLVRFGSEEVMRFPSLLTAVLTIVLMERHGRRLFGRPAGFLLALVMAFSPVYLCFFYQLRGYSMSIFLGVVATIGSLYLVRGERQRGLRFFIPAAILLPGVIPSNVLVNLSLLLFVGVSSVRDGSWRRQKRLLALLGLASVGGLVLYLPILPKVVKVLTTTQGWDSGLRVTVHLVAALAAHAGIAGTVLFGLSRQRDVSESYRGQPPPVLAAALPVLFACCALPILLVALLRAPFPRAFLAYLGPFTFCALWFYRPVLMRLNKYFYLTVFFVLSNALVWTRMTAFATQRELARGAYPQDLLQQYYGRNKDISTAAAHLAYSPMVTPQTKIFIEFEFYQSLATYWAGIGKRRSQIECLRGGSLFPLKLAQTHYRYLPQLVLAYNAARARQAYKNATGIDAELQPVVSPGELTIFRVLIPSGQRPPFIGPPTGGGGNIEI